MYAVTARFLAALAESHTPVFEAKLFRPTGAVEPFALTGGSVTVDRKSATRRTCSVQCADTSLIPRTATDRLATYGAQVRLARGVQVGEYREVVPLGVFRLDGVDGDVDVGPVTLQGKSLECVVSDDKFTAPYRASGTVVSAITALIQRSLPTAAVVLGPATVDAPIGPRTWDVQADPWAAVQELAAVVGAEVYCDADGTFVIATLPDPLSVAPVWTVKAGAGGAYISAGRGMSADGVKNGWLVSGENTETDVAPVQQLVVDTDPTSPTYWGGPFGRRPDFYSSATIINSAAAIAAGNLLLRKSVAPNASADITSLPNPALEAGDVLRVIYPDGTKELHQANSFTVPLEIGGDFTIATISGRDDA